MFDVFRRFPYGNIDPQILRILSLVCDDFFSVYFSWRAGDSGRPGRLTDCRKDNHY